MKVKILQLGLFEKLGKDQGKYFLNPHQLSENFLNVRFCFNFQNQPNSFQVKKGSFDPLTAETRFFLEDIPDSPSLKIISRQPSFFVFTMPFPIIRFKQKERNYLIHPNGRSNDSLYAWSRNPFRSPNEYNGKSSIDFPKETIDTAVEFQISSRFRNERINDFTENQCLPLFIEKETELFIIMNDYRKFFERHFGVILPLDSFSKIVIPFFEIYKEETLKNSFSYLPF